MKIKSKFYTKNSLNANRKWKSAERPASSSVRSGRGIGFSGAATASSVRLRPRNRVQRSGLPLRACNHGRGIGFKIAAPSPACADHRGSPDKQKGRTRRSGPFNTPCCRRGEHARQCVGIRRALMHVRALASALAARLDALGVPKRRRYCPPLARPVINETSCARKPPQRP